MKTNIHVRLAADIIRTLVQDPSRSNHDLSRHFGVSEGIIRRHRATLELSGLLPVTNSRVGSDGIERAIHQHI
jgi:hypothetical protein